MKSYFVYILSNWAGNVIYIGVTSHLEQRIFQHKQKLIEGFSEKYNTDKLVYFEEYTDISQAIEREKQLKNWRRDKKDKLISGFNPQWKDLSETWYEDPSTSAFADASADKPLGMTGGKR